MFFIKICLAKNNIQAYAQSISQKQFYLGFYPLGVTSDQVMHVL